MEAHVRIDEGVKRPRFRTRTPQRHNDAGMSEAVPPGLDPDSVLRQYLHSPTSSTVARDLGVRRSTLTAWLRKVSPEKWKAVQIVRADLRKEDGDEGIYNARDPMELARARELLRSGQWDLERLDSSNYGQHQLIDISVSVDVSERLQDVAGRLLEHVIDGEIVAGPPLEDALEQG